jgi:hypothetical protein
MQSIKGIYREGKVELLEPVNVQKPCKVIVTFVGEEDIENLREYPADEDAFSFWKLSEEDIYQDYLKKPL